MDSYRGYITKLYTVWCGKCSNWNQKSAITLEFFKEQIALDGWRLDKHEGWVCPRCVRNIESDYSDY